MTTNVDLASLAVGQTVKLNGRTYKVATVIDMAAQPNSAKYVCATYAVEGKRGAVYSLNVRASRQSAYLYSITGMTCPVVEVRSAEVAS
jgi:hypothetical protein